jgi:hypothetical protein
MPKLQLTSQTSAASSATVQGNGRRRSAGGTMNDQAPRATTGAPGTAERTGILIALEGRRVSVALKDGSRIDDCQLVSSGRKGVTKLWLYTNGEDVFVPHRDVVDVWEPDNSCRQAA